MFKERQLVTKNGYKFREVYVQNRITYDEFGQLYFENFELDDFTNVFATNTEVSSRNLYKYYKTHAVIKTIVEELKNDFKLGIAHSHDFYFNDSLAQLSGIAYNVKNMFVFDVGLKTKADGGVMKFTLQRKFIQS